MVLRADNPDRTPPTTTTWLVKHYRPKGFAVTEGLPPVEPGRLLPYKEDSEALHTAIISGDQIPNFHSLEPSTQSALLWISDLLLAVAVDGGAQKEPAIGAVTENLGRIASLIPQEDPRG